MKLSLLLAAATALFAQAASADVLYNRSNIRTGTGNGFNGSDTSTIAANSTTFGYSSNSAAATFRLADRFVLSGLSTIQSIVIDAYSTSTYPFPPTSPFTGATMSIWNGQPGAGGAVLFTSTTLQLTAWTGIYRVSATATTNAQRPVMTITMAFNNVTLPAGTYWVSFGITGVASPGVSTSIFTPPVMNSNGTLPAGTALQSGDGGATWTALTDTTAGIQVSVPVLVNGTAVPEPSSVALMVLGGAGCAVAAVRSRGRR